MANDQDLTGLPKIKRWHATGDYAYPAEGREDGEFVEYEAYCTLARENAELRADARHAHARWSEFAQLSGAEQRKRIRAEAELAAIKATPTGTALDWALRRAEKAEAELASLKQKIAEAETGIVDRGEQWLTVKVDMPTPHSMKWLWKQRVALLPVGGDRER